VYVKTQYACVAISLGAAPLSSVRNGCSGEIHTQGPPDADRGRGSRARVKVPSSRMASDRRP